MLLVSLSKKFPGRIDWHDLSQGQRMGRVLGAENEMI